MSGEESSPPRKRHRLLESVEDEVDSFSMLSDDVLLRICGYLDMCSLLRLSETCDRLRRVVADKSLWAHSDSGSFSPSLSDLRKIVRHFLGNRTRKLRIKGQISHNSCSLSQFLLESISLKAPELEKLIFEDHLIDAVKIKITDFPDGNRKLHEFRLTNCSVINALEKESYFKDIHLKFPALKVLDLSNNGWVSNHSLLAICKLESLEELSLRGCLRIGECFVYTALATRFGFRRLKVIDVRETLVGNPEIQCVGRLPMITRAYFGNNVFPPPRFSEGDGKIEDKGIASLIDGDEPSSLTHLTLNKTELTDKMLSRLCTKLPLEFLDIRGTKVTSEGVERFKVMRPSCKLLHST